MAICHLHLRLDLRRSTVLRLPAPICLQHQVQPHLSTRVPVHPAATPLPEPHQADRIQRPLTDHPARMALLPVQHHHHPPATVLRQVVQAIRTDHRQLRSIITHVVRRQTMVHPSQHHLPKAMAHRLLHRPSTALPNRHLLRPDMAHHLVHPRLMVLQV